MKSLKFTWLVVAFVILLTCSCSVFRNKNRDGYRLAINSWGKHDYELFLTEKIKKRRNVDESKLDSAIKKIVYNKNLYYLKLPFYFQLPRYSYLDSSEKKNDFRDMIVCTGTRRIYLEMPKAKLSSPSYNNLNLPIDSLTNIEKIINRKVNISGYLILSSIDKSVKDLILYNPDIMGDTYSLRKIIVHDEPPSPNIFRFTMPIQIH